MPQTSSAQATSLVKALRVLLALEGYSEGRRVTEIARALELPKSAVHRLLVTFQAHGFVQQRPDSRYGLGPTLARLGLSAAEMFIPSRVAHPHLEALAHEVEETVFLGVLSQATVMIVDKVEWGQVLRISPALGAVLPLSQTGLGKLLLAFCPAARRDQLCEVLPGAESGACRAPDVAALKQELVAIKRQGFAVSLEEWAPDVCCLVAPIRNGRGEVSAALALALPSSRMPQPQRHDPFASHNLASHDSTLLSALLATAERISEALP
ncbi:MAG: IclR family transcriptional regulator [bacterium]|nr:IclR family transcriptional regulator [bacterium]